MPVLGAALRARRMPVPGGLCGRGGGGCPCPGGPAGEEGARARAAPRARRMPGAAPRARRVPVPGAAACLPKLLAQSLQHVLQRTAWTQSVLPRYIVHDTTVCRPSPQRQISSHMSNLIKPRALRSLKGHHTTCDGPATRGRGRMAHHSAQQSTARIAGTRLLQGNPVT